MKSFLFNFGVSQLADDFCGANSRLQNFEKEARMNIRINFIYWKEGHLLPRLLACQKDINE